MMAWASALVLMWARYPDNEGESGFSSGCIAIGPAGPYLLLIRAPLTFLLVREFQILEEWQWGI